MGIFRVEDGKLAAADVQRGDIRHEFPQRRILLLIEGHGLLLHCRQGRPQDGLAPAVDELDVDVFSVRLKQRLFHRLRFIGLHDGKTVVPIEVKTAQRLRAIHGAEVFKSLGKTRVQGLVAGGVFEGVEDHG